MILCEYNKIHANQKDSLEILLETRKLTLTSLFINMRRRVTLGALKALSKSNKTLISQSNVSFFTPFLKTMCLRLMLRKSRVF